jgi:hypothetical protein
MISHNERMYCLADQALDMMGQPSRLLGTVIGWRGKLCCKYHFPEIILLSETFKWVFITLNG